MTQDKPEPPMGPESTEGWGIGLESFKAYCAKKGLDWREELDRPTTGSQNRAIGVNALMLTNTAGHNTAIGYGLFAEFGLEIEKADGGLVINGESCSWDTADRLVDSALREHGYLPGEPRGPVFSDAPKSVVSFHGKWWHKT